MIHPTYNEGEVPAYLQMLMAHGSHSERVSGIARILNSQEADGGFSKRSSRALTESLSKLDQIYQIHGVDFSRAQLDTLVTVRNQGAPIEFETLGPYLIDYLQFDGKMKITNLIPEDKVGLSLARAIRPFLPSARLISLYDEYNSRKGHTHGHEEAPHFTKENIKDFRASLITLFQDVSVISADAIDGEDFLLIPESSKLIDAENLVNRLESHGLIAYHDDEIHFVNDNAENPLYQRITLRTKQGRWLCQALDAAAFLKPENQKITHLVVLPSYMRAQQDKVWEILRTLHISPTNYHNIFYDPDMETHDVVKIISEAFRMAETLVK
ncbi:MAG TPA: hypothetical protein VLG36_00865 [Candidatus Chromulinivoraceae bacterium]|nr:hypothetical protein [Candidatus Chromulinivoraceae bacterium]